LSFLHPISIPKANEQLRKEQHLIFLLHLMLLQVNHQFQVS